jgi:hypothetical protein
MISNKATLLRETKGIISLDTPQCFKKHIINRLFLAPRITVTYPDMVEYVYVAIDPNSGTKSSAVRTSSDYAVISAIEAPGLYGHKLFLAGAESIDAHVIDDFLPTVISHISKLRHQYKNACIVIMSEMNTGHESGWLEKEITTSKFPLQGFCFMDDRELGQGLLTTHRLKQHAMVFTRELIDSGGFGILTQIITHFPLGDILQELRTQLITYSEIKEKPTSLLSHTKIGWTGKLKNGMKDDMCFALQLLIYWRTKFKTDSKYKMFIK